MEKKRYAILDDIRGLILINMIIYHTIWNSVYIFGEKWRWYGSEFVYCWQQSICWGFILLSGFCWSFGKVKWKRGVAVFAAGLLVSLSTFVAVPENTIIFGVLTCLGTCMLLMVPLHPWLQKKNPWGGIMVSFGLFLLTRNINYGCLGFGEWTLQRLPGSWYANLLTAYFGLPPADFVSADYFSVFPWFFLFLTGYFLHNLAQQKRLFPYLNLSKTEPKNMPLEWMGRHSLFIYLLHQPVIYGVLCLCYLY